MSALIEVLEFVVGDTVDITPDGELRCDPPGGLARLTVVPWPGARRVCVGLRLLITPPEAGVDYVNVVVLATRDPTEESGVCGVTQGEIVLSERLTAPVVNSPVLPMDLSLPVAGDVELFVFVNDEIVGNTTLTVS